MARAHHYYLATAAWASIFAAAANAQTTSSSSAPVQAEPSGGLAEIVVTAQRRSERLEDVPASVSAVTAATLATQGITSINDIGRATPGVNVTKAGAFTTPTVRGIGNFSTATGYENNVAVYVDGFYVPATVGNAFDLNNIDRIEVLKGPQGTLFGRNATGGAILVVTRDPSFQPSAELEATAASYNDYRFSFYGTTGIGSKAAIDLAVFERTTDGYTKDLLTGTPTAQLKDLNIRSKLLFKPTADVKITLALQYANTQDPTGLALTALNYNTLAKALGATPATIASSPHETSLNFKPLTHFITDSAHLKVEWNLGAVKLTSLTQYDHEKDNYATDLDGSYVHVFEVVPWKTSLNTFAQDLNLSSANEHFNWVAGVFFFYNRGAQPQFFENGTNANVYVVRTTSGAAYADGTYKVADRLALTLGARYSVEESNLHGQMPPAPAYAFQKTFRSFTPRVALRYELAPHENIYASIGRGFKSGFFFPGNGDVPVNPEKVTAYEVGYKVASSRVRFDAAAYYYDYKDIQVSVYDLLNGGIQRILNAASANIKGLEANLEYLPSEVFDFKLSGGYTHGVYEKFTSAINNIPNAANAGDDSFIYDASGRPLLHTPRFSGNAVVQVHAPLSFGKLTLAANYFYSTKVNFILSGRINQPNYGLLGLRATIANSDDRYRLSVFSDNVLNKNYLQGAFVNGLGDFGYWGPPRVIGVTLAAKI